MTNVEKQRYGSSFRRQRQRDTDAPPPSQDVGGAALAAGAVVIALSPRRATTARSRRATRRCSCDAGPRAPGWGLPPCRGPSRRCFTMAGHGLNREVVLVQDEAEKEGCLTENPS
ncbi:unnamed protein product [Prorocentrum cordatum]|uniref:Uncharacterized protein n=1 Tax=Prorocentrum cordatum TaxID=2364126 RepID=A0ABN9TVZ3_9DINO|nr:unnamed protein product [Polarella glacialis]